MRSNTPERAAAEEASRVAALIAQGATDGGKPAAQTAPDDGAPVDLSALMARPEVQSAIASATAQAVAAVLAKIQAEAGPAAVPATSALTDRSLVEALALAIGEMNDQGRPNARRTVAPHVLAQRERGHEAMIEAILRAHVRGVVPEYALTGPVYLSETWVAHTWTANDHVTRARRVKWPGVPNLSMQPVDEVSREIHGFFREWIGATTQKRSLDPLADGFKIIGQDGQRPEGGDGRGAADGTLQLGDHYPGDGIAKPVHILGTIADPAQPVTFNG